MSTGWPPDQAAQPRSDDADWQPPGQPSPARPGGQPPASADPEPSRGRGRSGRRDKSGRDKSGRDKSGRDKKAAGGEDEDYEWIQSITGGRGGFGPADPPITPAAPPRHAPPPAGPVSSGGPAPAGSAPADSAYPGSPSAAGPPPAVSRPSRPAHGLLGRRAPDTPDPAQRPPAARDAAPPVSRFPPDIADPAPPAPRQGRRARHADARAERSAADYAAPD